MAVPKKALTKAAFAPAPKVASQIVKIHVKFTLNTPDGLRRVIFDLEKDTADDGSVTWKITFDLFERAKKSDDFGDAIVEVIVEVDIKLPRSTIGDREQRSSVPPESAQLPEGKKSSRTAGIVEKLFQLPGRDKHRVCLADEKIYPCLTICTGLICY